MVNALWTLIRLAVCVLALVAVAAADDSHIPTEADVNNVIDRVLGDHEQYRAVYYELQSAVAAGDAVSVANLVRYPIGVSIDGDDQVLGSSQEFVENYRRIMTPEILDAIKNTAYRTVMVNAQGIMLGNGEVWISGICEDDTCEKVDVKVVTLQSGPD